MSDPVILNFDDSIRSLPGCRSISLQNWQERIRYGCSLRDLTALESVLNRQEIGVPNVAFLGSGDFHHVSYLLIKRMESKRPFQVVVFDNHPDNMRYPWGIHCGSWVHHLCRLPFVWRVTVIGMASNDIRWNHLLENYLLPLYTGKLFYLCFSPVSRLARLLGLSGIRDFRDGREHLGERIEAYLQEENIGSVYLSIDKDVLSPQALQTNWDQGILTERELIDAVSYLRPHLIAADVTGEISFHSYQKPWKRVLSRLDGQSMVPPPDLDRLQSRHQQLNQKLLQALS